MSFHRQRERRLKQAAVRAGLQLIKSWTLNRKAPHFRTYALIDPVRNTLVLGNPDNGYGMTLDEVEEYLAEINAAPSSLVGLSL